jgi:hypothetical protein
MYWLVIHVELPIREYCRLYQELLRWTPHTRINNNNIFRKISTKILSNNSIKKIKVHKAKLINKYLNNLLTKIKIKSKIKIKILNTINHKTKTHSITIFKIRIID